MKVQIVPTILTPNFSEFKKRLKKVEPFFDLAQIDCEDGKFVRNRTFYNKAEVRRTKAEVDFELHLMVKEPFEEIKKWIGYKKLKSIIFHFEAVKNDKEILEVISYLHKRGIKAGLAINLETKTEKVLKYLPLIDILLILGVKPGWGGQKIKLKVVKYKVHKVRKLFPKLDIEVDGGVNLENAGQIVKAGANILAIGKSLSSEVDIIKFKKIIKEIKS
jgi:ribulose-phosphate 3-epimerase